MGGALALIGCLILWPSWEPERLARATRAAIAAHGRYARAELSAILGEMTDEQVDLERRAAGVSSNNLEASLSRAFLEPGHPNRSRLEAALVIDAALRRIAGRLSTMQLDPELPRTLSAETWRTWRDWIAGCMEALAAEGPVPRLPKRPPSGTGFSGEALSRIARQIELMAGALPRVLEDPDRLGIAGAEKRREPGRVPAEALGR